MKLDPGPSPPPVKGFRFSGVHGGLKSRGRRDFALIVSDKPAACAAVFTLNRQAAAPVVIARDHAGGGRAQAIMINSGNANAATGEKGMKFAEWSCRELASRLGIATELVVPCSTGIIGVQLERTPFARAISLGVDGLSRKGFAAAARAIMTSDAFPKWAHRKVVSESGTAMVAGMAKGAGMIHPNMATMLAFVLTDAPLATGAASSILRDAVASTFNRISVDGDTSTNDTVVLLASGQSAGEQIENEGTAGYADVCAAVREVMDDLARMVVRDGEGGTHVVDIVVAGAADADAADKVARAIGRSLLFKCAVAGADPNWGRIVCAIGNSEVDCDSDRISIDVDDVALVRGGTVVSDEAVRSARKTMRHEAWTLRVGLGDGAGSATVITCDLTEDYVRFNSAYSS